MKKLLICSILFLVTIPTWVKTFLDSCTTPATSIEKGVMLGTVIAIVTSWSRNFSALYPLFHGSCSWLYVNCFMVSRNRSAKLYEVGRWFVDS